MSDIVNAPAVDARERYLVAGRLLRKLAAVRDEREKLNAAYQAEMADLDAQHADVIRQCQGLFETYGELVHPYGTIGQRDSVSTEKPSDKVLLEWAATHRPEAIKSTVSVSGLEKCGAKFTRDGLLECPDENGEMLVVPGVVRKTVQVLQVTVK